MLIPRRQSERLYLYHVYKIKIWQRRKPGYINLTFREIASISEKKAQWRIVQSKSAHSVLTISVPSDYFDDGMNLYHMSLGVRPEIMIKIALDRH